jgi:undecaprenyl diphosphate synthase
MTNTLRHLALIPDGNRRWAKAHKLPILAGHRRVVEQVLPQLVRKCLSLHIPYFTIWGFSTENWRRSSSEVSGILELFHLFCTKFGATLNDEGVRITFIGRRDNLDPQLAHIIEHWTEATKHNERLVLTIAFNYGGRDEILRAVNTIISRRELSEVGASNFAHYLDTTVADQPDPDLIIRTGGEKRLSGFMSWQSAYSELYFSDKYMPDWTDEDLQAAVDDYYARQRRYGQ